MKYKFLILFLLIWTPPGIGYRMFWSDFIFIVLTSKGACLVSALVTIVMIIVKRGEHVSPDTKDCFEEVVTKVA